MTEKTASSAPMWARRTLTACREVLSRQPHYFEAGATVPIAMHVVQRLWNVNMRGRLSEGTLLDLDEDVAADAIPLHVSCMEVGALLQKQDISLTETTLMRMLCVPLCRPSPGACAVPCCAGEPCRPRAHAAGQTDVPTLPRSSNRRSSLRHYHVLGSRVTAVVGCGCGACLLTCLPLPPPVAIAAPASAPPRPRPCVCGAP